MNILEVYDPALCCSTGVCGPTPDSALTEFASTLETLKKEGVSIKRYNLAQEPLAFAQNDEVKAQLGSKGDDALPLVFVNGELKFQGNYPTCSQLSEALNLECEDSSCCSGDDTCCSEEATAPKSKFVKVEDPTTGPSSTSCCDPKTGCC